MLHLLSRQVAVSEEVVDAVVDVLVIEDEDEDDNEDEDEDEDDDEDEDEDDDENDVEDEDEDSVVVEEPSCGFRAGHGVRIEGLFAYIHLGNKAG